MKLRNKKTGGIDDFNIEATGLEWTGYTSLREFCEDWEDYEEPKEYWYIDTAMMEVTYNTSGAEPDVEEFNKGVGNYFDTKEEAEKAVEKLKAWKRLKDAGFEFGDWFDRCDKDDMGTIVFHYKVDEWNNADLDLLFRGEE